MSKRICLLIDSLGSGGAEKMVANLSHSLVAKGYDVTIVSMIDNIVYNYSGKLYNFGKIKAKLNIFKAFSEFKNFFKTQAFDVVLDHRVRINWFKEFFFAKFIFNKTRVIYCVHHYEIWMYFPIVKVPFLSKICLVKNRGIVTVSKTSQQALKKQLNLDSHVIYNYPLPHEEFAHINPVFEYIIAVGRLEKIKQFDVLIDCYDASKLKQNNIKLLIFGEGDERKHLKKQIENLGLQKDVFLEGFSKQVSGYIAVAKALVMTSKSEGFPMVLIEANTLKTPIISFNCKSGPNEIIENGINGILVKNQDKYAMTNALNNLLDDSAYFKLKNNLLNYNSPFTEDKIIKQWINLIEG